MGSQTLELKWANHKANMTLELQELYLNDALLDVTIACGEFSLKAHKTVLSASSTFFRKLFLDNPCQHPILIMTDVDFEDLKTIVEFMYQGEIHISREKLSHFLKTADKLKIKGLTSIEDTNLGPSKQSEANVDPNCSNDTWECTSTPSKPQDPTGTENACDSPKNLTEYTENDANEEIQSVKLEEDSSQPKNSCMYWQNECFDQTSSLLPDCNLPSVSAVSQLPTSTISHQPAAASVPHQLSTFTASSQLTSSTVLHEMSSPPASHQHGVPLNSESVTYPESQADSLVQMQDENTGQEVSPVNLYLSDGQSSLVIPSSSKSVDVVVSNQSANQSSSETSKTDHALFAVEEYGMASTSGTNAFNTERNPVSATFQCEFCRKEFLRKDMLQKHLDLHSLANKFICTICGYRFNRKRKLVIHHRTHSGDKPFQCDQCFKRFSQVGHLQTHKRIHTGEKPYQCPHCCSSFSRNSYLKQHVRLHTGEKPYKCGICDLNFTSYNSINRHKRKHYKNRPV